MSARSLELYYRITIYVLILVIVIVTLMPFMWLFSGALKAPEEFFNSTFIPLQGSFPFIDFSKLSLENFQEIFNPPADRGSIPIFESLINSLFLAGAISILATLFSALAGFALAKLQFKGREFFTSLVLAALIIPPPLLVASSYQVLYGFGLLNTYMGLILPALSPAFGIFLFRQAMLNSIPNDLLEAARIDGCGEIQTFFVVVLPLVRPMVATFLMLTFLGTWNNFIGPQIVLQDPEKFPLSVAIAQLRGIYGTDYGMICAGTVTSIMPVAILFLIMQKEFIAGLTAGSVKG